LIDCYSTQALRRVRHCLIVHTSAVLLWYRLAFRNFE